MENHVSQDVAKQRINEFLNDPTPEILVVKGGWGTGKTHLTQTCLSEFDQEDSDYQNSSYVSLFAAASIDELKAHIFLKTEPLNDTRVGPDVEKRSSRFVKLKRFLSRAKISINIFEEKLGVRGFSDQLIAFFAIEKTILCVDDFERSSLCPEQVLGLLVELREEKGCKVILLMNEVELSKEERETLNKYRDKVVDREFRLFPSAQEAFSIVYSENEDFLLQNIKKLNTSNIRVVKKIQQLNRLLQPRLAGADERLQQDITRTLILFTYLHFGKMSSEPPLEFVKNCDVKLKAMITFKSSDNDLGDDDINAKAQWIEWLENYGFDHSDDIDREIASYVQTGFLNEELFDSLIDEKNRNIELQKQYDELSKIWDFFHSSFEENKDAFVNRMHAQLLKMLSFINPGSFFIAYEILRKLDAHEKAEELLVAVEETREEKFFDTNELFGYEIEGDTFERLKSIYVRKSQDIRSIRDVLLQMIENNGWDAADEDRLAALSKEDYYDLFTSKEWMGDQLTPLIRRCLQFRQYGSASNNQKTIAMNVEAALKQIAQESKINKLRVAKFKVRPEPIE